MRPAVRQMEPAEMAGRRAVPPKWLDNSVPAADFAADVYPDFCGVAGEGYIDRVLYSRLEDETALRQVGNIAGDHFDKRLSAVDSLGDHDGGERVGTFLPHSDGGCLAVTVPDHAAAAQIDERVRDCGVDLHRHIVRCPSLKNGGRWLREAGAERKRQETSPERETTGSYAVAKVASYRDIWEINGMIKI